MVELDRFNKLFRSAIMELFPRQDMTLKRMFESNTVSRNYDDLEST